MRISKGYALFMVPTGETYTRLATLIEALAAHYDAPKFVPHVTLLGDVEIGKDDFVQKSAKLASELKPFQIKLRSNSYTRKLNKALFLTAEKTEGLMESNRRARKTFNVESGVPYEPHMSLIYGDFAYQQKLEMIEHFVRSADTEFIVDALHLFNIDGEIHEWEQIEHFGLS